MNYNDFVKTEGGIFAPAEFYASGITCGLTDIGLLYSKTPCDVCAIFTDNKFASESHKLTYNRISKNKINAIFFNNGNANSCTANGIKDAEIITDKLAKELELNHKNVAMSSSGLVGIPIKTERICEDIPELIKGISTTEFDGFYRSVCDEKNSVFSESACAYKLSGTVCKTGAMIKRTAKSKNNLNQYTCIITTDACIDKKLLFRALKKVHPLTVGKLKNECNSVSDITFLISSGFAGNKTVEFENDDYNTFLNSLYFVLNDAMKEITRKQGEKLVEWICVNAYDEISAEDTVNRLAVSDISEVFETGIFSDLITSIGVVDTIPDISNIDISLKNAENYEKILEKGRYTEFDSYKISEILDSDYLKIIVDLNCGESGAISFSSY